jgi:cytochrome c oxidase subunit 2
LGIDTSDPAAHDDIVTLNQLHLPVDKPALIHLSSKDVIHSFFLPVMRVKQDAIPGQVIPIYFTPTEVTPQEARLPECILPGKPRACWEIACAQLCGLTHYRMQGFFQVETEAEFAQWLAAQPKLVAAPPAAPVPAEAAPAPAEAAHAEATHG